MAIPVYAVQVYRAAPEIARIMDDEYGVAEDELVRKL